MGTHHVVRWLAALAAVVATPAPVPAYAEWLRATSRHFIVYSNTSDPALRKQTTALENFDATIRTLFRTASDAEAEANRVTVYVMPDVAAVQKISRMKNVAGFYVPRVTGSVAFTPRMGGDGTNDLTPRIVLFHEYAHHFLFGSFAVAYPAWFSEGYAEFASTMNEKGGYFWIGNPANHRAYSLMGEKALTIRQLFEPPPKMSDAQIGTLYGRGWLLTHYLMFDLDRRRQLARYIALFNEGKPSVAAATEAFGDLKALDSRLEAYLRANTLPAIRLEAAKFPVPQVDIRPLTAGERALITLRMESTRGVGPKTAAPLYAKAKVAAAPFATDAIAQGWLAEMAYDARQLDAAEAAADAAIAVDQKQSQALLYKARVHLWRAREAKSTDPKVWIEARSWIIKANRAMPDDAAALALFYESFFAQDTKPSKSAIQGLYRATVLAPQDRGLRFQAARQMILDGDVAQARTTLRPLASDPHAGADNAAVRLIAALDAGQTGQAALDALGKAKDGEATDGE